MAGIVGVADQPQEVRRPVFVNEAGNAARFAVVLRDEPLSAHAIRHLRDLEARFPSLLRSAGLTGVKRRIRRATPRSPTRPSARCTSDIARVALARCSSNLSCSLIFLRALVAPLYLLAASVLALAASLGVTTWLFQDRAGPGQLTYYVPLPRGAAALARLRLQHLHRRADLAGGAATAVPRGDPLRDAGRVASGTISIAALILAGSFAAARADPDRPCASSPS